MQSIVCMQSHPLRFFPPLPVVVYNDAQIPYTRQGIKRNDGA